MPGWTAIGIWCAGALAVLAAAAPPAMACSLTVADVTSTVWTGNRGQGYDVFDPQRRAQAVTFRVRSHNGSCSFFATVAPVAEAGTGVGRLQGGQGRLRYEVSKDASGSRPLKPLGLATNDETFTGSGSASGSMTSFQFAFSIPPGQVVPPGHYSDDLEIAAYEGTLANPILRDRRRVKVNVPVPAVAELSFSEGGGFDPNSGSFTVNFNNLRAGMRSVVRLKARSNAGYRITFQSENGGLRNINPTDDSLVHYETSIDGSSVTLSRGALTQAILNSGMTDMSGQQHVIDFTIGDIGSATAGDYIDTINLSVFTLR